MDLMSPASKAGGETRPSRSRDPLSVFLRAEEPKGEGSVLQFPLPQGDLPRSPLITSELSLRGSYSLNGRDCPTIVR